MNFQLRFLGAAESVTGSRHLLEFNHTKVMVDCGLYQERDLQYRNWEDFGVHPADVDAILLTHAHLDHCGLLPKFVKEGFKGKIFCTEATAQLAKIVLADAGKIQEEDAEFKRKRHKKANYTPPRPVEPLYTIQEAEACFPMFKAVAFEETVSVADGIKVSFHQGGHILGSSIIQIVLSFNGQNRTVLFTGDLGRVGKPILKDPAVFDKADYILVESTYGDRQHTSTEDTKEQLYQAVIDTINAGGNIVVPSFSIERSQEVLYYMNELLMEDRIPHIMTFLDSPMAVKVTDVFKKHPELYDAQMARLMEQNESPFSFRGLKLIESTRESKAINHIRGTVMIIAGSGMCTGGRIKHHLVNNITRPESTILFVGYQASGTLGRTILDSKPGQEVRILGQMYPVRAKIVRVHGFSAHADREEILAWLKNFKTPPKKIFIVHGEKETSESFKDYLIQQTGWSVMVPKYQDVVKINGI
ncbi:MAG TPA: MBL fold metallo-hydrolase [Anaerohalosphaeraceae bacterium]|nr:MBL fold metallo-hydrolase [Anaerohalosphaeraceae bacterium]HOL31961.1 MBL fold metallo-hydrolase [Anaerohalosphaeraceae bacterium]HOM77249.1 MBL fold metallo-hydrolase [Anaerohalosphaeraceae bacterium]HPC63916.1 MBL fold metallo-hydrolase [Anaerohalosphaeraceae bacterium]HPO70227.1 MBL fold metallo-hydrolase [Anaerohalosphaeraceae bacterium]